MSHRKLSACAVGPLVAFLLAGLILSCNLPQGLPAVLPSLAPGGLPTGAPQPTTTPASLPTIKAVFTDGDRTMFLDSGTVKIGVDKNWGGAIREVWLDNQNLVNNYDGGRLLGVAFYDSAQGPASSQPNDSGWNPSPSDMYNHTNPPLTYSFDNQTLYIKTRQSQWYPNDKGGGPDKLVYTDIIAETWISFVGDAQTVHLRYKLTHEGADSHVLASQEFPFAYVRLPYRRFVTYSGSSPWTNDNVDFHALSFDATSSHLAITTEYWGGLVDDNDVGLMMWAPQNYDNFTYEYLYNAGPLENATLYILPRSFFEIGPGNSQETNAFLYIGKWQAARQQFYTLHSGPAWPDIMPPMGNFGAHAENETVSGVYTIDGWAIDNSQVASIIIRVDGKTIAKAAYGNRRPDVDRDYPGQPDAPNFGFTYPLDTTAFANGSHSLEVAAVDTAGNTSKLIPGPVTINIQN
jgi:hypothetical protein